MKPYYEDSAVMQLNLEGETKLDITLMRIREFGPPEGYYLAFSGGKDSITIYDLAVKADVKFDAHYNMTGIDPPELVQFIRANYPQVEMHRPAQSIFKLVQVHQLPRRQGRWCCELLKETGGHGRIVMTGVRWAESSRRKQRRLFEVCTKDGTKKYLNPIIDWGDNEVWNYIRGQGLNYCSLYDEGFKRLGCVMCPMTSAEQVRMDMARWPKIADAWRRAANRLWGKQTEGLKKFKSGDDLFNWWISRRAKTDESQCVMFE